MTAARLCCYSMRVTDITKPRPTASLRHRGWRDRQPHALSRPRALAATAAVIAAAAGGCGEDAESTKKLTTASTCAEFIAAGAEERLAVLGELVDQQSSGDVSPEAREGYIVKADKAAASRCYEDQQAPLNTIDSGAGAGASDSTEPIETDQSTEQTEDSFVIPAGPVKIRTLLGYRLSYQLDRLDTAIELDSIGSARPGYVMLAAQVSVTNLEDRSAPVDRSNAGPIIAYRRSVSKGSACSSGTFSRLRRDVGGWCTSEAYSGVFTDEAGEPGPAISDSLISIPAGGTHTYWLVTNDVQETISPGQVTVLIAKGDCCELITKPRTSFEKRYKVLSLVDDFAPGLQ